MRLTAKEIKTFRATLPEYRRDEQFQFFTRTFDVVRAQLLVAKGECRYVHLGVQSWANALGMNGEFDPDAINIITGVADNDLSLYDIDVSKPIIMLDYKAQARSKVPPFPVLIDGNHRLRKAYLLGMGSIDAAVIPYAHQKFIQVKSKCV